MAKPFSFVKSVFAGVVTLSAMSLFVACGGEEKNPAAPSDPVPSSSSVAGGDIGQGTSSQALQDPASSSAALPVVESSSSAGAVVPPVSDNPLVYSIDPTLAVTPDADGFYYIADIYKALPATSKVVFVIRHSEREKSEGQESLLTANGEQMAIKLGADMGGDEPFYYASTDFIRTRETCKKIAEGRGETAEVVTWDAINGSYFLKISSDSFDDLVGKRGGSWKNMSQWAYGAEISAAYVARAVATDTVFYDLFERGHQFVNEVVLANLPSWKRVNFLASHDVLLEPLTIYATNRAIDLKFYDSGKWINYIAGVAIVVNEAGAVSLFPVRGADQGWMYYVKME